MSYAFLFRVFLFKPLSFLTGRDYEWYGLNYFTDFFSYGPVHSENYLKYPHMLDCHSAFHLLPEINAPTLVVSGMLDVLTPSYHSYEMASRMPNCEVRRQGARVGCEKRKKDEAPQILRPFSARRLRLSLTPF